MAGSRNRKEKRMDTAVEKNQVKEAGRPGGETGTKEIPPVPVMPIAAFREQLLTAVPQLTEAQAETLYKYMEKVLDRNRFINLTAVREPEEFLARHYIDSLDALRLPEYQKADTIIDVGTGGGFPGIPLALASPEKRFVLMDSLRKRLRVIREFADDLEIGNVEMVHGRAEDLGRNPAHRERYDLAVSRAVADLPVLCEYCLPLVKPGGFFLAYKGPEGEGECRRAAKAIQALGGRFLRVEAGTAPGMGHTLCLIQKLKVTPEKFPRKAGIPSKEPLG